VRLLRRGSPPGLPSFPARRSSDLLLVVLQHGDQCAANGEARAVERVHELGLAVLRPVAGVHAPGLEIAAHGAARNLTVGGLPRQDRKSTRLNSSHVKSSYAGSCLT